MNRYSLDRADNALSNLCDKMAKELSSNYKTLSQLANGNKTNTTLATKISEQFWNPQAQFMR